jgi:hypothetical protein
LAVSFAALALPETGVHGRALLDALIACAVATALIAIFFNQIVKLLPNLDLPRRLRGIAQPKGFFTLLCLLVIVTFLLDYSARVSPGTSLVGSYLTQDQQSQPAPFVPTHARIRFPEGSNGGVTNGKQENVWFWTTINTGAIMGEEKSVFERSYILIIFSRSTAFPDQLLIYPSGGGGRVIPPHAVAQMDERFAEIVFYGSLSGFDLDITNVK